MPIYKKLPRSKPKKPDEFISFFDRLYHEAYKRGPAVLAVLAVLALVGTGVLFWKGYHTRKATRISESLFEASKGPKEDQEKTLNDIKKAHPYAPLGIWASLTLANQAEGEGRCESVVKELEPYVGHNSLESLKALIYLKVGTCYEDRKDLKKAQEVYEKASSDDKNPLKDWSYLRLAAVKKESGDVAGSGKILNEIIAKDFPASPPVKDEARTVLALVALKSPETAPLPETAPGGAPATGGAPAPETRSNK